MNSRSNNNNKPTSTTSSSYSFSSFSNKQKSSSPLCCGTTEITTTTITSSPLNYWSEGSVVDANDNMLNGSNSPQQISDLIANCLICFWPTMQSLRVGHDDDEDSHPHNDCFVAVSSPPQLLISEQNDWHV